jgi:transcriptional regulator with XRE-family HTH domain
MGNKQYVDKELLWRIGDRIKTLREEKGITQEKFLHETDIHIGRIERAGRNISISTLSRICKHHEITLEDFFAKIKD